MKNKIRITIERINEGIIKDNAKFEIAEDSAIDDWKYLFTSILAFISFDIEQIKDFFDGYSENETENYN